MSTAAAHKANELESRELEVIYYRISAAEQAAAGLGSVAECVVCVQVSRAPGTKLSLFSRR